MGDFSQNGIISTLHDFGTKSTSVIESELSKFSEKSFSWKQFSEKKFSILNTWPIGLKIVPIVFFSRVTSSKPLKSSKSVH